MKIPMKNMLKAAAFCIVLTIFLNRIYEVFAWKDTAGDYYSSLDSFYKLEEDVIDVLFLGSSRCYCTINNSVLWEEEGIAGFSLAISGQDIASSYHCIVEALKTQTPEVICLELYGTLFHGYGVESNVYRNVLGYKMSPNAIDVVNSIAPERKGELLLRWPIIHTRYKELKREDFVDDRPVYLGYSAGFVTRPVAEMCTYFGEESLPIGEEEEKWLRKIIAIAEENEIGLCFFVSPFVSTEEDQKKLNYVGEIAVEHGIPVANMSKLQQELEIDTTKDFIDWAHTNYNGSKKASMYMADYLKQNFVLSDRRGETGYELWDEDLETRRHEYQAQMLIQTMDTLEYVDYLASIPAGYTLLISSHNEYEIGMGFDYFVDVFGLEGYYDATGIWMIQDGQVTYKTVGVDALEFFELDGKDLIISSAQGSTSVVLDKQHYMKVGNGINVIVYDNVLKKVVDAVGFEATEQYKLKR